MEKLLDEEKELEKAQLMYCHLLMEGEEMERLKAVSTLVTSSISLDLFSA